MHYALFFAHSLALALLGAAQTCTMRSQPMPPARRAMAQSATIVAPSVTLAWDASTDPTVPQIDRKACPDHPEIVES